MSPELTWIFLRILFPGVLRGSDPVPRSTGSVGPGQLQSLSSDRTELVLGSFLIFSQEQKAVLHAANTSLAPHGTEPSRNMPVRKRGKPAGGEANSANLRGESRSSAGTNKHKQTNTDPDRTRTNGGPHGSVCPPKPKRAGGSELKYS